MQRQVKAIAGGERTDQRPVQLLRSPVNRVANLCQYETKSSPYQGMMCMQLQCYASYSITYAIYDLVFSISFHSYGQGSRWSHAGQNGQQTVPSKSLHPHPRTEGSSIMWFNNNVLLLWFPHTNMCWFSHKIGFSKSQNWCEDSSFTVTVCITCLILF